MGEEEYRVNTSSTGIVCTSIWRMASAELADASFGAGANFWSWVSSMRMDSVRYLWQEVGWRPVSVHQECGLHLI